MTTKVPIVPAGSTLASVRSYIEKNIEKFDTIHYIHIVDDNKKLIGIFSQKDLYRFSGDTKVDKIAKKKIISLPPNAHQEEAANLALEKNIKAVPLVDDDGIFLGTVSGDEILKILHKELREDLLKIAGVHRSHLDFKSTMHVPLLQSLKHRLPWLLLGLIGGLLTAYVIDQFEETIAENIVLAAFIPLVVYLADAVRVQLEAFAIRDFVVSRKLAFARYFFKQLPVVVLIALFLGLGLMAFSYLIYGRFQISLVLGAAVVGASISALVSGLFVPFLFRKLKVDPADASGPIGTVIQDVMSVLIYFSVAARML